MANVTKRLGVCCRTFPVETLVIKLIAVLSKKPGLSRDDFINYYETGHVPLIRKMIPQLQEYRRNYVDPNGILVAPGMTAPDFDVVTEFWFADRAALEEALATYTATSAGEIIRRDEENFLDRGKMSFFIVDEHGAASQS
jgi:uncharacterized protein (TIGR02118 family)